MYLVFLKIPNKVAHVASDGVITGCDYAVPERYINPAQDLDLYLEIQRGSQNGFASVDEAKAWADEAVKKIFKFIHSTPKVRRTYTKAYIKIADSGAMTETYDDSVKSGWRQDNAPFGDAWGDTVGGCYPEWSTPVKGSATHLTYDMSDFVANLDPKEVAATKEKYAASGKQKNPSKVFAKFYASVPGNNACTRQIPDYELESYEKDGEKALDNVPLFAQPADCRELGLAGTYYFLYRVGPWLEVKAMSLKYERGWCAYSSDQVFGNVGRKRWLVSETDVKTIEKDVGNPLIDISSLEPWGISSVCDSLTRVPEMYRYLKYLGIVPECAKYKK